MASNIALDAEALYLIVVEDELGDEYARFEYKEELATVARLTAIMIAHPTAVMQSSNKRELHNPTRAAWCFTVPRSQWTWS